MDGGGDLPAPGPTPTHLGLRELFTWVTHLWSREETVGNVVGRKEGTCR